MIDNKRLEVLMPNEYQPMGGRDGSFFRRTLSTSEEKHMLNTHQTSDKARIGLVLANAIANLRPQVVECPVSGIVRK